MRTPPPAGFRKRIIAGIAAAGLLSLPISTGLAYAADNDKVNFSDSALEKCVKSELQLDQAKPVTEGDMKKLVMLQACQQQPVKDISALGKYAINLESLNLDHTQVVDLKPLSGLTKLKTVILGSTQISDLSPLTKVATLETLFLANDQKIDRKSLAKLTNLSYLNIHDMNFSDLSPIAELSKLTSLTLQNTDVNNVNLLSKLTNLEQLDLSYNKKVRDISPLAKLTKVHELNLEYNEISDLKPLTALTKLTVLKAGTNKINDVSPLAKLTSLEKLTLGGNQISDLKPLAALTNLKTLDLNYNKKVGDISPLAKLTNLKTLGLSGNQISDLKPLAALTKLTELDIDENVISDISPLAKLTNLRLTASKNMISDFRTVKIEAPEDIEYFYTQHVVRSVPMPTKDNPSSLEFVFYNPAGAASATEEFTAVSENGLTVTKAGNTFTISCTGECKLEKGKEYRIAQSNIKELSEDSDENTQHKLFVTFTAPVPGKPAPAPGDTAPIPTKPAPAPGNNPAKPGLANTGIDLEYLTGALALAIAGGALIRYRKK